MMQVISLASLSTPVACLRVTSGTPRPDDLHEWISFEDPGEHRTWLFDATYLASNYKCIYGCGCKGILDKPSEELQQGCCSFGAHFADKADVKKLVMLIKEKGHSRIPLYSDDVDNILGIIHIKDLLPYIGAAAEAKSPNLLRLARPAYFVPETKKLDRLLHEFRQEKGHMAIVVDEYGGTAGLVTLEDVIEEIIGDIQDEYDKEAPLFKKIEKNVYDVDAKIGLDELNDALDFDLPTDGDYESLGGFILNLTGYVPDENEVVRYENYDFLVEVVVRNRIKRVRLTVNQAEQEEET